MSNLYKGDCIDFMSSLSDNCVNLTLTDIPYDGVNRTSNGIRNFDKKDADVITFDLYHFLDEVNRVTKDIVIIFCGFSQLSTIFDFFNSKKGTTRVLVWHKSNPSPVNGQHIYLSGVECAIWFKNKGSDRYNGYCKNTVFNYSIGRSKLHPTEKTINY